MKKTFAVVLTLCLMMGMVQSAFAADTKNAQETTSSSKVETETKSQADKYVAPLKLTAASGKTVTDADIAKVITMYPKAFYSVPGDNHDGTLNDKREGMDFRIRKRQPYEFFAWDVERLLIGYCRFDKNGALREYYEGTGFMHKVEPNENADSMNKIKYLDSWTVAWFDEHDTSYMHLSENRISLIIAHPPENEKTLKFVAETYDTLQNKLYGENNLTRPLKEYINVDTHIGDGAGRGYGVLSDVNYASCECGFIYIHFDEYIAKNPNNKPTVK